MPFQSRRGTPPPDRAGRCLTESFVALDQPLPQPAFSPEPALQALHPAGVAFVVIPHQMEKTVQGEHAPLGQLRMAGLSSLTPRHAARDYDVAEDPGLGDRGSGLPLFARAFQARVAAALKGPPYSWETQVFRCRVDAA